MSKLLEQIDQAVTAIRGATASSPRIGIILGTGLGALVSRIEIDVTIAYESIPNFPVYR